MIPIVGRHARPATDNSSDDCDVDLAEVYAYLDDDLLAEGGEG